MLCFFCYTLFPWIRGCNLCADFNDILMMYVTNAFCSGGDQALRTEDGYSDHENISCLNVLDLQVQIRRFPNWS
ncbi:1,4-dihydroxy-2-naphthoyl-CoA synthase [Trifolium repens]|nr:1,4-dihydroxy-2-naphthoyl-CoA synthase [Trifolium repens]